MNFPIVDELLELKAFLEQQAIRDPLYVFYGTAERWYRPELDMLSDPDQAPDWLRPAASSSGSASWVLYRYAPGAPHAK